jgi:hypothetical protein
MSDSLILYIGTPEQGQALAAAASSQNSYVYQPETLMDALGMYITYFPDIVVIDMAVDYAQEAFDHLRSVDAEPLVVVGGKPVRSTAVYSLPSNISPEALLRALDRFGAPKRVLNGLLHYA